MVKKQAKKQLKFVELPRLEKNQRYNVQEAAALLRQSRAWTFKDIKRSDDDPRRLRVLREGKKLFIPGSEIERRSTLPVDGGSAG